MLDDASAVAALERNAWSMFSVLGHVQGARVIDTPTRLVVETPVRQAPYNTVWRFYEEAGRTLGAQVDELIDQFAARGVTGMWLVHPTAPRALRHQLTDAGWVCAEEIAGMVADLRRLDAVPSLAPDVRVDESTADRPDEWVHLVSWRYGLDTTTSPYLVQLHAKALDGHTRLWIARVAGVPASKVGLHIDGDGIAGIYGVASTAAARHRGLAPTLTLTALHAARDAGARTAVLHSTPMARTLYARLGFRDVATFEAWSEPDRVHL